jgi:hypothetical protein
VDLTIRIAHIVNQKVGGKGLFRLELGPLEVPIKSRGKQLDHPVFFSAALDGSKRKKSIGAIVNGQLTQAFDGFD